MTDELIEKQYADRAQLRPIYDGITIAEGHRTSRVLKRSDLLKMKKPKIVYWIITGLMAAFMLLASIPDVLRIPEAVATFTHLGYPGYLLAFIGFAKILAVLTILIPGFSALKEWAYAGLVFDLIGAWYSHIAVGDPVNVWIFPLIGLLMVLGSYFLYQKIGRRLPFATET